MPKGCVRHAGRDAGLSRRNATSFYSWYVLGVLFLVYVVNFIDRNVISILAQDIKADLAWR